jgi:hypothetical protein
MINIGNLLDFCGISYTDKQLSKLDKLFGELLKKLSLQQFDSIETTKHDSRNEEFATKTELNPLQPSNQDFDFKFQLNYNNTIKEEIQEDGMIEIKEEFSNDPFASLETFNNSEGINDIVHKNHILNKENRESSNNILITPFDCHICEKKFSRKDEIKRHTDSVHEKKKPHQCLICDKQFARKSDVKRHTDSVHEEKKPHKCTICDYSCSLKADLKGHIESVHEKKKPHKCSICDYSCFKKHKLNIHIASVHEKKKPHKCSHCDYSCSEKGRLKRHIESVHEKKKPHKCSICENSFSEKSKLKAHIVSVHSRFFRR